MTRLLLACMLLSVALPSWAGTVRIVATLPDLAAIADQIAGEHGKVTSLAMPTQDPHFVDARPNLALAVARADMLVLNGLDLEIGWLPTLITGSRNANIQPGANGYFDASQFVQVLQVPTTQINRSMGDIHPGGNPHYTLDPTQAVAIAHGLAARLGQIDPDGAPGYSERAAAFEAAVAEARAGWDARLAAVKGQPVIDFHRSWPYAEAWMGFEVVSDIEPKPGIPPTPKHVAHVLQLARSKGVKLVVQEAWFPDTVARTIADRAGARLAVVPGQTDFQGGQSYVEHIDEVVARIAGEGS